MSSFWDTLPRPIVGLAPMDGVTDAPFRLLTAQIGRPDIIFTEFVPVEALAHSALKVLSAFRYDPVERPIVAQVYGTDVAAFKTAAHIVAALGFDGLDINMGCPAKKVARRGAGAALITNTVLAEQIIKACKEGLDEWASGEVKIADIAVKEKVRRFVRSEQARLGLADADTRRILPLSVKTRIGYTEVAVEEWALFLASQPLAAISWHGRTLKQLYSGTADWEAIGRAAAIIHHSAPSTLVLGNGDITSRADALDHAARYGVDGVLIGRAALGNPWAFTDQNPLILERSKTAVVHARLHEELLPPAAFPAFRRHLAAYIKGIPHASTLRASLMRAESAAAVEGILSSTGLRKDDGMVEKNK